MIINGKSLLNRSHPPIVGMATEKLKAHGTSYGLSEAGYDIRLKQDLRFYPPDLQDAIGAMNGNFFGWRIKELFMGRIHVDNSNESIIGRFTLASAIEEFDMPTDLIGVVHDKSTWARQGVSVFNTVIEPGWKGFLTLEIVFHGNEPVHIPAGSGIAQVVFHQLQNPAEYNGKYQNQKDEPVPSKWEV